jgi:hypothetical protein
VANGPAIIPGVRPFGDAAAIANVREHAGWDEEGAGLRASGLDDPR